MLRPNKHSHPDRTVVSASLVLLSRLKRKRLENFDSLLTYAKQRVEGGNFLFLPALNLLFILGLVEYRPKNDSFEYVGK